MMNQISKLDKCCFDKESSNIASIPPREEVWSLSEVLVVKRWKPAWALLSNRLSSEDFSHWYSIEPRTMVVAHIR